MYLSGWSHELALCPATRLSSVQYDREGMNLDLKIVFQLFVQTLLLVDGAEAASYHFLLRNNMEHRVRRLLWQHRYHSPANVEHCGDGYLVRFCSRCT